MKIYKDKNVFEASLERIEFIFNEFDHIYVSLSAGKDSSATIQLVDKVAKKLGRKFDVLFVDYELQYKHTLNHAEELKSLGAIDNFYHVCWSFKANNATSIFNRFWYPWDKELKTREYPKDSINEFNYPEKWDNYFTVGDLFLRGIFKNFSKWYMDIKGTNKACNIQGLRADESMNRFRSIAFGKNIYKGKKWTTDNLNGIISAYPIYDYRTEDVWTVTFKEGFMWNKVYEEFQKIGIGIHDQRIAQPFGLRQKGSLGEWAKIEPDTWEKMLNRVSGTNFGALYSKSTLLGNNGTSKPAHLSWEEYAIFLLETTGIYCKDLEDHYYRKIKNYIDHYIKEGRIKKVRDIEEEISKKEVIEKYGRENGRWIQWKRIAIAIEKNDFALSKCNYGITKKDKEDMLKLKKKWGDLLGLDNYKQKEYDKVREYIEESENYEKEKN